MLVGAVGQRNVGLMALALDLLVPPLALLVLALSVCFCLTWLFFALSGLLLPALICSGAWHCWAWRCCWPGGGSPGN